MTGIRVSCVFRPESEFGEDTPENAVWYRLPSGLTVDYNPTNNMSAYNEIGNKFISNVVAGMFSGSGSLKFKLDYECINFFGAVCEDYSFDSATNTHTFKKSNGKRIKSFSLMFKKLNRVVGGSSDSTIILRGCVAKSFSQSMSSGSATLDVTVSFDYAKESRIAGNLDSTDWEGYYDPDGQSYDATVPVEWECLNIGDVPVAYTESATFSVSNGVGLVKGCGSRFNANYQEGMSNITLSTSCYAVDEATYYTRMYSGGVVTSENQPREKGLAPIPEIELKSGQTLGNDTYAYTVIIKNVYVDSDGSRSFNPNSRINDTPNFRVKGPFEIRIKNTTGKITIWDDE